MRLMIVLIVLLVGMSASAREVWHDEKGFSLMTVGWLDQSVFPDWIGVKIKLSIPTNGYVYLEQMNSLELHLPCRGWVSDMGIVISDGCIPDPQTGRDTLGFRYLSITEDYGCDEQDGDILMVVRIPRMFPTKECRPDSARWAGGYCNVED